MQLHQLRPIHKPKKKKRVGRGGKKGDYSGKGIKGQNSRSGRKKQPFIRELTKRYHKLRGYRQSPRKKKEQAINVSLLKANFKNGEKINPDILLSRKIVDKIKGKTPAVKILGKGELNKKFIIENCLVSKGAREKIEKAGGRIID